MSDQTIPAPDVLRQLIDYDPETGVLTWRPRTSEMFANNDQRICNTWNTRFAGKEALGHLQLDGYKRGAVHGVNYLAHRVAFAIHTGAWPKHEIDHINGVRHDNRISNLRDVPKTANQRNSGLRSDNKTGQPGVCWHKAANAWVAQIWDNGTRRYLGVYADKEEAVLVRQAAQKERSYHPNHGKRKGRPKPP